MQNGKNRHAKSEPSTRSAATGARQVIKKLVLTRETLRVSTGVKAGIDKLSNMGIPTQPDVVPVVVVPAAPAAAAPANASPAQA